MVARTPPKQQRTTVVVAPIPSPTLLRETVKKVDKCMARLQELQNTVRGGTKHESLRIRNGNSRRSSPAGKMLARVSAAEHWRRMSLPAMLLGETMGEVLQATQFATSIVEATAVVSASSDDPKTPPTVAQRRKQKTNVDNSGLMMKARRRREKQVVLQSVRSDDTRSLQRAKSRINFKLSSPSQNRECNKENFLYIANRVSPRNRPVTQRRKQKTNVDNSGLMMQARRRREKQVVLQSVRSDDTRSLQRAKSRINFKLSLPSQNRECDKENCLYMANRVSPRNMPWVKKSVLFPNPLFHSSSPTSQHQKLGKNKSPVIARNRQMPHKFLIKSPTHTDSSKFQVKIKSNQVFISPTRTEKASSSMRRSFSPLRLASRLISPLKSRNLVQKKNEEAKYSEIARSRQLASYKLLIKSSPPDSKLFQGKIKKSTLVSTSPTRATSLGKSSSSPNAKLGKSLSPSRLVANRITTSTLKIRNLIHKNEGTTKIISGK